MVSQQFSQPPFENDNELSGYTFGTLLVQTKIKNKKAGYDFEKTEISFKEEAIWEDTIITVRKYYSSGQLQSEEPVFFAGQKDCKDIYKKTGTHKFWTVDGKLEKKLTYKDDKPVDK